MVYPHEGHLFYKPSNLIDVLVHLVGWFDDTQNPQTEF